MDLSPFKLDIDELVEEFAEGELKTLADIKKLWQARKFSYIFEGRPSSNLALFMQTLYSHSMSHMISSNSLSHQLGALYCLYCLYETQPFKPPFKIYLSLGELRRLRALVVNAKENGIKVLLVVVKRMLEKNTFLFGSVNVNDYSEKERIKELVNVQNACIKKMHEKLLASSEIEQYLHMDLGMELDLKALRKLSSEYAETKSLAIREASEVVDVQNIKHISEDDRPAIGDEMQKLNEEWGNEKESFTYQKESRLHTAICHPIREDALGEQLLLEGRVNDDEIRDTSFMELLMGNESPQANWKIQPAPFERNSLPEENDYEDVDFARDLENQLFEDEL